MNLKPSWKDAPEWARYLAQDGTSGTWYWYESKPDKAELSRVWVRRDPATRQCVAIVRPDGSDWKDTLEKRP